jgi:dTDP-glucose 4,6-dehydratase
MHANHHTLVKFVPDRLGHDQRYSINSTKATTELAWQPKISFDDGLQQSINWHCKYKAVSATEF